nr:MCE family protein [Streptacidiphilus sp. PB12-B1b]
MVAGAVLGTGGCSGYTALQDLPLPGGAALGSHPYTVRADFTDVLSLVPQASVEVNDVPVGRVTRISLAPDSWTAVVTMEVNGDVQLPGDAYASLEQSSLLGEKYVSLSAPPSGQAATGRLGDGDTIPLARTNRSPEVEEVFGALSLLLNGGGVQQLKTISTELNQALSGNEPEVRDLLGRLDTLVGDLDAHRQDITAALDGLNRLSSTLAARNQQINTVLSDLSPGLDVLSQQRQQLVTMLQSLDTLSGVATDTVNASKADLVADLKGLAPTLQRLADAGQALPDSLQVLVTYPFTDQVLNGVKGDYLNTYLELAAPPDTRIIPALSAADSVFPPPATSDTARSGKAGQAGLLPFPLPSATATRGGTP